MRRAGPGGPQAMPELPEVEHLRRTLTPRLVGKAIVLAALHRRDVLVAPGDPPGGFSRARERERPRRYTRADLLMGERVAGLDRRGKRLAIIGASGRALVVQLGMSGSLRWAPAHGRIPTAHRHASWTLDDGSRFAFIDPRRFGGLRAAPTPADLEACWGELGPDAIETPHRRLAAMLVATFRASRRPIKSALLDQRTIAGCGNIYADEALFEARVHPMTHASDLDGEQVGALTGAMRRAMTRAIEMGGSSIRDYVDASGTRGDASQRHAVYGRAGRPCLRCGATLEHAQVAQRTTVWCPTCQPQTRPGSAA